jgi:hypothetical protein
MRTAVQPRILYGLGVVLLAGALLFGYQVRHAPEAPEPVALDVLQTLAPAAPPRPAVAPDAGFDVNIVDAIDLLAGLAPDEREEQLADWAAYGVITRQGADAEAVSNWAVSHPPYRTGGYERVANYTYGPGRSFAAADGTVWLIYEEGQPRMRTLAQQADKLRALTGDMPSRYAVFRYSVDLPRAAIRVEREADVPASEMFSETFGYVAGSVSQKVDLEAFLAKAQDLTYIDASPGASAAGRGIVLGGRRFTDRPLGGAGLDDVAVLYKAHTQIAREFEALDRALSRKLEAASAADEYNAAVESLNSWIARASRGGDTVLARRDFGTKASALRSALAAAGMQVPEPPSSLSGGLGIGLQRTLPDRFTIPDTGSTGTLDDILRQLREDGAGAGRQGAPNPGLQAPSGIDPEVWRRFRDRLDNGAGGGFGRPRAGRTSGTSERDSIDASGALAGGAPGTGPVDAVRHGDRAHPLGVPNGTDPCRTLANGRARLQP